MSFDAPGFLYLLFLLAPLSVSMLLMKKRRAQGAVFLAAPVPPGRRETLKKRLLFRAGLSDFFFILFAGLVIFAFSGPRWGAELKADTRRGLDLMLAFDISQSMNVRDCPPLRGGAENSSRLERALAIARELTLRLEDARLGTAAGKGRGVLMVPLTYDSEAILGFLDSLDPSFLSGPGTNLESLLEAALGGFNDDMSRRRGILLFSDGENLQGSLETAVNRARREGVIISAAGLGSSGGGVVPVPESLEGVLLNPEGSPVISSRQEETLQNVAEGGTGDNPGESGYVDGNGNDAVALLTEFYLSLSPDSPGGLTREAVPRWHIFVMAGLFSLGISRLLGFRRKRASLVSLSLLAVFAVSSCAPRGPLGGKLFIMEGNFHHSRRQHAEAIASFLKARAYEDAAPYAEYGLGLSYVALEEKNAALERYSATRESLDSGKREHRELRYRLTYNMGIIHFEGEDYSSAAEFFRQALEIDGSRLEAKRNLELSLLAQSRSKQSEPASSPAGTGSGEGGSPALFDYLRQKEQEQWKSREWNIEPGPSVLDY